LASPCEKACEAWIQTAQGCNDHCRHEGDRLAAALGPWLLCWRGAQEEKAGAERVYRVEAGQPSKSKSKIAAPSAA
jgi:hypothetical protein